MASLFLNREGNISAFKIGVGAAAIGGVMLVVGFILTQVEQASFRAPLDVPVAPNTTMIVEEPLSQSSRRLYYQSSDPAEVIVRFYDEELAKQQGLPLTDPNRDRCVRTPREGTFENYREGNGIVPYEYKCLFQESSLQGLDRFTTIIIQPGVRNDETGMDYLNTTRIEYEQYWQP